MEIQVTHEVENEVKNAYTDAKLFPFDQWICI